MYRYTLRRLLQLVVVLLLLSVMVFVIVRLIPGDPAAVMLGTEATPEAIAATRQALGLDGPLLIQYLKWVGQVAQGHLGTSWVSQQDALVLIARAFPVTLQLTGAAFVLAILIAAPVGILSALRPGSRLDQVFTALALMGLAVPNFWLGILLILAFSLRLPWFPPSGHVPFSAGVGPALWATALPALTLGVALAAPLTRFLRSGMLDVMGMDYVRTARAKGLTDRRVALRHALKNAVLTVVTVLGLQISALIGGSIVIEQVFNWPGIGRLSLAAIQQRDYGVVQGIVLFVATAVMLTNFLVDLLYAWLDPRIRYD